MEGGRKARGGVSTEEKKVEEDFRKTHPVKLHTLHEFLSRPSSELHYMFLQSVIPVFDIANKILQEEAPFIDRLHAV